MTKHRQARVKAPPWESRKRIRVDAGIAPLLRHLWSLGLITTHSCEDWGDGMAQIIFYSREMAESFAERSAGSQRPPDWRFETLKPDFPFPGEHDRCTVYFPREIVLRYLARHRK